MGAVTGMDRGPYLEQADFSEGPLILYLPLLRLFAVLRSSVSCSSNCAPRESWSAKLQTSVCLLAQDMGSRAGRTDNLEFTSALEAIGPLVSHLLLLSLLALSSAPVPTLRLHML